MGIYIAKIFGFLICFWAKREGYCPTRLMAFKIVEIVVLLMFEVLLIAFLSVI